MFRGRVGERSRMKVNFSVSVRQELMDDLVHSRDMIRTILWL